MMKLSGFLLFFFLAPFVNHAQTAEHSNIDVLGHDFVKYLRSFDKEQIQLQTDRHIYASGETIYFKAFLVDSLTNQLRGKPKKLFVDLVNDHDSVLEQLLLNASTLKTAGAFVLNDSLDEGYYWIRAYTEKMAAEDPEGITVAPLYVINAYRKNTDNVVAEKKEQIDPATTPVVQIFPEGGHIISAITSTVAVKVTDGRGNPLVVQGVVKDNKGAAITKFSTNTEGLSKFSFNPFWYRRYTISVMNKNNYDSIAVLPPIDFFSGQVAVAEQTDTYVKVRVALEDSIYTPGYSTYLMAISGDSICFSAIGKGMYEVQIPLNNFSHGISHLLLFNTKNQLLSERDIFINKENYKISIDPDKDHYEARENAQVDLFVTDQNNKPVVAALAVAVTDMRVSDTVPDNRMQDTLQRLAPQDADLIMLTHKSKLSNWNPLTDLTGPISESLEQKRSTSSLSISGTVTNQKNEPASEKVVTIFSKKDYMFMNTDTTDVNGKFSFSAPDFIDSTEFAVQVSNLKGEKQNGYHIVFDKMQMPRFVTPVSLKKKFAFDEKLKAIRNEFYEAGSVQAGPGGEWLKPVVVNGSKGTEAGYDETKRVNPYSHIITHKMIIQGSNTAGNALLMVPGVHSTGNNIAIGGPTGLKGEFHPPLLILNGTTVSNSNGESVLDFVNSIPKNSIDFIEVLTGSAGAIYGVEGGNGVVLVNTTNRYLGNETDLTGFLSFYPTGFYTAPSFPMRDYNNKKTKASKVPDLRTTIYWNGNLITSPEGKATFNFFTADRPATYLLTITGITVNGDKVYKTVTLNRN